MVPPTKIVVRPKEGPVQGYVLATVDGVKSRFVVGCSAKRMAGWRCILTGLAEAIDEGEVCTKADAVVFIRDKVS